MKTYRILSAPTPQAACAALLFLLLAASAPAADEQVTELLARNQHTIHKLSNVSYDLASTHTSPRRVANHSAKVKRAGDNLWTEVTLPWRRHPNDKMEYPETAMIATVINPEYVAQAHYSNLLPSGAIPPVERYLKNKDGKLPEKIESRLAGTLPPDIFDYISGVGLDRFAKVDLSDARHVYSVTSEDDLIVLTRSNQYSHATGFKVYFDPAKGYLANRIIISVGGKTHSDTRIDLAPAGDLWFPVFIQETKTQVDYKIKISNVELNNNNDPSLFTVKTLEAIRIISPAENGRPLPGRFVNNPYFQRVNAKKLLSF